MLFFVLEGRKTEKEKEVAAGREIEGNYFFNLILGERNLIFYFNLYFNEYFG